jgi:hypothetical protein
VPRQAANIWAAPALTPQQQAEARKRRADGATLKELAKSYNVGIDTIARATRMTEDNKEPRNTEAFAVVGELVMISSALDHLLNNVLIEVLDLGVAPLLEPVVATLDPARKVEILKERAAHITAKDWQKGITKFCDKVESVFRQRNIACHTPPVLEAGIWTFKPVAAAKLLKKLDLAVGGCEFRCFRNSLYYRP